MILVRHVVIALLTVYRRVLSPLKTGLLGGPSCRFFPSCSAYALEAVQRHGVLVGSRLTVVRLCRCHPWGGCGHDPVPDALQ